MNTKTKNVYLLLAVLFLICCSKENEPLLNNPETNIWKSKAMLSDGGLTGAVSFVIDDKLFVGTGIRETYENDFYVYNYQDNSWESVASLPSNERTEAISFSIGNYGYVGLGMSCIGSGFCTHYYYNDLWRYESQNDSWTKMADFPGTPRAFSTCFVIGDKAYVTGGSTNGDNDLWEYDSSTDAWTQKTDYPGGCISRAVSFSLNNKGYVGFGWSSGTCNDFWEYDPLTDSWIEKEKLPGEGRYDAVAFTYLGKGYVACGMNQDLSTYNYLNDFWTYDQLNDTWIQINTNYPGKGRMNMIASVIENKIMMGLGIANAGGGLAFYDLWEYIPE